LLRTKVLLPTSRTPAQERSAFSSDNAKSPSTTARSPPASFARPIRRLNNVIPREAPDIAKDPVADSTDLYAFISPDNPDTVTIIANYIPLQAPDGGPNFFEFGDDVLYEIKIDNNGDGSPDVTYQFNFRSENQIPTTFLYNDGPSRR